MAGRVLLDTGAIVGLIDADDAYHAACKECLRTLPVPFVTSAAVLTEAFYLLGDDSRAVTAAWVLLRRAVTVLPITDADLPDLEALMAKYAARPLDFADATLVHLARRESISTIFTVDNDDFETYRIDGRRKFRVVPGRLRR